MALANGADVRIGGVDFMLATDVDEPYIWIPENLFPTTAEIAGTDKKTANQNILLWTYDNFIEGEGLNYYDKDQPARWKTGNNNPRIPGAIQSPPTRSLVTIDGTASSASSAIYFTVAQGRLWAFTSDSGYYTTDLSTWTENTDVATELPASYVITSVCTDGDYAYFAASDGTNRGIWKVETTEVASDVVAAHAQTAASDYYRAITVRDNYLYAWTGGELYRYDITGETQPITHSATTHKVATPRAAAPPVNTLFAFMDTADNSVVFTRSYGDQVTVFEHKLDSQTGEFGTRELWDGPIGFEGGMQCVNNGVLYLAGIIGTRLCLWGISLQTRQPLFLGYFGEHIGFTNPNLHFVESSNGAQILIGVVDNDTTNYIFVYDAEEDAFSQLDEVTTTSNGALGGGAVTYAGKRVVSLFVDSDDTSKSFVWNDDSATPAGSWDWDSAAWDMDYPQDEKVLLGFHVVQDPAIASGTVNVDYQLDEDGSWIDAGTTSAGAKHTYIQVSDGSTTRKFRTLRMRMTGASGCRVLSITARAYVNTKQETWRLTLDLNNEPGTKRRTSERTVRAANLRDRLRTLVTTGSVVTFLDGRRYPNKSDTAGTGYTSHTCLIEFPKGSADSATEGKCEIILRSVAPSA